jgi:hypothetical protein
MSYLSLRQLHIQADLFRLRCQRTPPPQLRKLPATHNLPRAVAVDFVSAGHNIVILAHSSGEIVASEALAPELYTSNNDGKKGIVSLVYLAAFLVQPGGIIADVFDKYGFQCRVDLGQNDDGTVLTQNASDSWYNDITEVDSSRAEGLANANVTHNWLAAMGR